MSVSSRARNRRASTGEAPPVDTAATSGERSMIDVNTKVHTSGLSTTLTGTLCARAAAATRRFTASSLVAAPARRQSRSSSSSNTSPSCRSSPSRTRSSKRACRRGAITVTRAPARNNKSTLRAATSPPPTTKQRASLRSRKIGNHSTRSAYNREPAHVGLQDLGYLHAAVAILIVLHDRDQRAAHGETRAIQGMHELGLAGLGIAPSRLQTPRLKILEVAARGDLAILLLARQPHLEVVGLGGREPHVAGAERHHAIRQPQQLQHLFGVARELFEGAIGILGPHDLHQLDLLELMLAYHAARVLTVGARLAAEARRVRDISARHVRGLDDHIAHDVGDGYLRGGNEIKIFLTCVTN